MLPPMAYSSDGQRPAAARRFIQVRSRQGAGIDVQPGAHAVASAGFLARVGFEEAACIH
ncbi:hypothetical protein [Natronoglycomyces albus]|uniref:Uncharacterized protein n=1 Tax=Natronoglycomyces albus TaxID=2811108 RepID=A0A895XW09_9ACTN|nr:hypothetical protein [Natronoglycomyces albus]QSB05818.1 hypothetical protein JQS30_02495 [Natronoglycomyces albus]